MTIYKKILEAKVLGKKLLTMLIDPDTKDLENIYKTIDKAISAHVDCFFIGGSLLHQNSLAEIVDYIKSKTHIPVILFPGNTAQVYSQADATLFPSVISGRNPELLIGRHVESAGLLRESGIEVISLGYMLIDSGLTTTVNYITNTSPIPYDNTNIAISTAIAGELLGMKMIYLEAGSGAPRTISSKMINQVSKNINVPLIVGGGIKTPEQAEEILDAGADMIVVGNALETNDDLIFDLSATVHSIKTKTV
ncbi:geranylgeranylglyceryl/heptaprenylglyceryl phosphate synthase [bacterium]|nr:geranylgeranylglyceryl/heptaprenylglyceryl phosphate synthase [bacterium]